MYNGVCSCKRARCAQYYAYKAVTTALSSALSLCTDDTGVESRVLDNGAGFFTAAVIEVKTTNKPCHASALKRPPWSDIVGAPFHLLRPPVGDMTVKPILAPSPHLLYECNVVYAVSYADCASSD
jgi:hypothetical protein